MTTMMEETKTSDVEKRSEQMGRRKKVKMKYTILEDRRPTLTRVSKFNFFLIIIISGVSKFKFFLIKIMSGPDYLPHTHTCI